MHKLVNGEFVLDPEWVAATERRYEQIKAYSESLGPDFPLVDGLVDAYFVQQLSMAGIERPTTEAGEIGPFSNAAEAQLAAELLTKLFPDQGFRLFLCSYASGLFSPKKMLLDGQEKVREKLITMSSEGRQHVVEQGSSCLQADVATPGQGSVASIGMTTAGGGHDY